MTDYVADRAYAPVYRVAGKQGLHDRLIKAVEASGGRLLYASDVTRAPVYLGIESPRGERIGVLAYPFTANQKVTTGRPADEHRLQIKYGGEDTWDKRAHDIGRDIAGIDTTLVLGVHVQHDLLIGLDPSLYDPLPMGISIEFKDHQINATLGSSEGWQVYERDNIPGRRRRAPRAREGLETVVMFQPHRLLDYVRFERTASDLRLDPALRLTTATEATQPPTTPGPAVTSVHDLERQFEMTRAEILEMISERGRLSTAVRGGVAEFHLRKLLEADPQVAEVRDLDKDGMHDFDVTMNSEAQVRVECKNASPKRYADGDIKVEVQKTRASQGDPAGRLYRIDQFDIVAACLRGPTGEWAFRYRRTDQLARHEGYPDRLAPLQRVTDAWASRLTEAL